jgi:hypothetical protein
VAHPALFVVIPAVILIVVGRFARIQALAIAGYVVLIVGLAVLLLTR